MHERDLLYSAWSWVWGHCDEAPQLHHAARRRGDAQQDGGTANHRWEDIRPTIGGRTSWQHGKNGFRLKSGEVAACNTFQARGPDAALGAAEGSHCGGKIHASAPHHLGLSAEH